jgi:tryptophanyl-tRNA synthetase
MRDEYHQSLTRPSLMETQEPDRQVILTGDRPTGRLHLGHYAGSLMNRVGLQDHHDQTILIADLQALTDNTGRGLDLRENVLSVMLDYLAVGLDPSKTTFALQSGIPALAELTVLYQNLVTVSRLERNPTIKTEIALRGFERDIPVGFLSYPVSQAADITAFRATLVPVGEDQLPLIEQTNEIVSRVNRLAAERPFGSAILPECRPLLSTVSRLPGTDGRKASKSLGNAIDLSATPEEIQAKVRAMFTDPDHLRVEDPGKVEGNVVFAYLDAFDPDQLAVSELKDRYRQGRLGDMTLKKRLDGILQELIRPIRERRAELEGDRYEVMKILDQGTLRAAGIAAETLRLVRDAFGLPPTHDQMMREEALLELSKLGQEMALDKDE